MLIGRCKGSSANTQMLPRVIDTVSLPEGTLLKRNGRLVVKNVSFALSDI